MLISTNSIFTLHTHTNTKQLHALLREIVEIVIVTHLVPDETFQLSREF